MILPHYDYTGSRISQPKELLRGLDRSIDQLVGRAKQNDKSAKKWLEQAHEILKQSISFSDLTSEDLETKLHQSRTVFRRRVKISEETLNDALSLICEAAARSLGTRPFIVQIYAALAIQHGYLAEMATGEGKTLTAALSAILTAWSALPCHVVTANDYLAARDAENLSPLYTLCSVTTGWVTSEMSPNNRRKNYAKDIVYTTGKELLADFLRDRLATNGHWDAASWQIRRQLGTQASLSNESVMRGIHTAIIDEADMVMIDEAVTPLIISEPTAGTDDIGIYTKTQQLSEDFKAESDYRVDSVYHEVALTESGRKKLDAIFTQYKDLFGARKRLEELVLTALIAKEFYRQGKEYLVDADKIMIVDEFTGRMMPERSWRQGLHQSIEARENLLITVPCQTLTQLSFQNFFRLFRKLSGLTGTARETASEFWDIYRLPVLYIPTNKPCLRKTLPHGFHPDHQSKWQAICEEIADCYNSGQPVLIGTRNVAASEKLSSMLQNRKIPHRLLNALNHHEEAEIISQAGQKAQITIATNMAGRGADIKLGDGIQSLGGLHVILTELHDSKRIDRQLQGRCARQGDPGSTRVYSSSEDILLRENLPKAVLKLYALLPDGLITSKLHFKLSKLAQKIAQQKAYKQRKSVLKSDALLSEALSFSKVGIQSRYQHR